MRVLLDTHIVLWTVANSRELSSHYRGILTDPSNEIFVSSVTIAEIAIKSSVGKLTSPDELADIAPVSGFSDLEFSKFHAEALKDLPMIHRDTFDRMLIAQAMVEGIAFATVDPRCRQYPIMTV